MNLRELLILKAAGGGGTPLVEYTATGNPATFETNVAKAMGMIIPFNPVQDLHGYENPWPAGGWKNKLPPLTSATINDVTITVDSDGVVKINGNASADTYFDCIFSLDITSGDYVYLYGFNPSASSSNKLTIFLITSNGNPQINMNTANASFSWQASDDTTVTKYRLRVPAGVQYTDFIVKPMLQIGGTAPTAFAPYSNICPISGWTGCNVSRTGKNLLKLDSTEMVSSGWNRIFPYKTQAGTFTISASGNFDGANLGAQIRLRDSNDNDVKVIVTSYTFGRSSASVTSYSFTLTETEAQKVAKIMLQFSTSGATFANIESAKLMIEVGPTASSYEAYSGHTYSITFPSEAGTVYGGTLTVNKDGTGELVVDRACFTLDGSSSTGIFAYSSANGFRIQPYDITGRLMKSGTSLPGKCNLLETSSSSSVLGARFGIASNNIYLCQTYDIFGDSVNAFLTYLQSNNIQLVYPLATPVTYQLSAPIIRSLLGTNNVWSDTNDSNTIKYMKKG